MSPLRRRVSAVVLMLRGAGKGLGARERGGSGARSGRLAARLARAVAPLAGTGVALLVVGAAPASASIIHNYEFSFNGSGTAGALSNPGTDAFSQATGDLWVLDAGTEAVDAFAPDGTYAGVQITGGGTPAGSFALAPISGVAVDNSGGVNAGDVYVADTHNGVVDKFSPTGTYLCQITGSATPSATECDGAAGSATPSSSMLPTGVAVDSSGDLFVADTADNVVDEFGPAGNYVGQIADPNYVDEPLGVAVDSSGDVYVRNGGSVPGFGLANIVKFASTGAFVAVIDGNESQAVAVDPASGHVYVSDADSSGDIVEYDGSGNQLSSFAAQSNSVFGLAVRPSTGEVYAVDSNNTAVDVYTGDLVVPDVTTGQATGVSSTAALLNGAVNPDGTTITDCQFSYVDDADYQSSGFSGAPTQNCTPAGPSGSSPVPVSAELSGLTPDTLYDFELQATNANGTVTGADQTFYTSTAPVIDTSAPSSVGTDEAAVQAQINPEGLSTTYHVDYGTSSSYGQSSPESASIGSGTGDVTVTEHLAGLQPDTTYHFRLVATNAAGTTTGPDGTFTTYPPSPSGPDSCPNARFRTGASAALPDCRAFEQVSPVDKDGTDVATNSGINFPQTALWVSSTGGAVNFTASAAFAGAMSACQDEPYLAQRTSAGWATTAALPPVLGPTRTLCQAKRQAFSADGASLVVSSNVQLSAGSSPFGGLYLTGPGGAATALAPNTQQDEASFAGASADLRHVFFETAAQLTPAAQPLGGIDVNLYETVAGHTVLVDVDDSGAPLGPDGALLGGVNPCCDTTPQDAVSDDGSKAFFTVPDDPAASGQTMLYMREDDQTTTLISKPAPGVSSSPQDATFQGASADGSKVFFSTAQQLTADDRNSGPDLYEYDTDSGQLTRISAGAASDPGFLGVLAVSADGSHVYFVGTGQLVAGPGVAGQPNLYVYDTNARTLRFVATLSPGDPATGNDVNQQHVGVTPDGMHFVFLSAANVTSFDSGGHQELYEYSAASGAIVCLSCSSSGVPPVADASLITGDLGASAAVYANVALDLRNVSDDGSRVVFQDPDALTPQALNDVVLGTISNTTSPLYAQNVYEWEQAGVGSCPASSARGCVYLIPDGGSGTGSWYGGMSASGDDIFIFTRASLVAADTDGGLIDVYDARVDGGFPALAAPTACQAQACHPGSAGPSLAPPGSTTFTGPGNAAGSATAASFHVLAISAGQRRALARTGRLRLRVRVSGQGRVTATVVARMTATIAGRRQTVTVTVARAGASASRAGTVTLRIVLAPSARAYLRRHRSLPVTITVAYSRVSGAQRATFRLPGGSR